MNGHDVWYSFEGFLLDSISVVFENGGQKTVIKVDPAVRCATTGSGARAEYYSGI